MNYDIIFEQSTDVDFSFNKTTYPVPVLIEGIISAEYAAARLSHGEYYTLVLGTRGVLPQGYVPVNPSVVAECGLNIDDLYGAPNPDIRFNLLCKETGSLRYIRNLPSLEGDATYETGIEETEKLSDMTKRQLGHLQEEMIHETLKEFQEKVL